jgi:hypothetical protein
VVLDMFASDAFSECALTALSGRGWARIRQHDVLCDSRQSGTAAKVRMSQKTASAAQAGVAGKATAS